MKVGEGNDEAELDNFLVQPAPPAGEEEEQQDEQEVNQDQQLDKKHVTKRGLLKVFSLSNLQCFIQSVPSALPL